MSLGPLRIHGIFEFSLLSSGVALASSFTSTLFLAGFTVLYTLCFKLHKKTWPAEGKRINFPSLFSHLALKKSFLVP